jgi:hypothetical protein
MGARPAPRFSSRVRNALAFVAIVWGVATTFVVFEIVSLNGVDLALSYPALFGNIALSRAVTESTSCVVGPDERPETASSRMVSPADARVGAWSLGVSLGRDAVFRQYAGSNRQPLDQLAAVLNTLAARLGVPAPAVFTPVQIANANPEFVAFIEQDASRTAHRLAVTFSPRECELFKLGAMWGYSEMVRPALRGERAVFAMEIRHHATRAQVPEALWSPMLQRTPTDAESEEVITQMTSLTNGVTTFLAGQQPGTAAP